MNEQNKLIPFEGNEIRKVWHEDQWFFRSLMSLVF